MVTSDDALPEDDGGIWHPGELELQRRIGAVEAMARIGHQHVRDHMPEQHRAFFNQLPFVVLGTVDPAGHPWAGLRSGTPGFVTSPDPRRLRISGFGRADDPMEAGLLNNAAIGLLGIELHTRRRNRMNGIVARLTEGRMEISVRQSFGNCPQYIQLRQYETSDVNPGPVENLAELDEHARTLIETADTFFVATYVDRPDGRQVDVSHRGGRAGFVAIGKDDELTIPDFAGNHFFATLGNILLTGRAGLLFADFTDGTLLQMTGRAEIVAADSGIARFEGAERFWHFRPERIVRRIRALPMRFAFEEWSPRSLATGSWETITVREDTPAPDEGWQPLHVTRIVDESPTIRSLYLSPPDGQALIKPQAGQYLPVRVVREIGGAPLMRTYTISSAPSDPQYRISVKRDGRVSAMLHALKPGDYVETKSPAGRFTVDALQHRSAVLIGVY